MWNYVVRLLKIIGNHDKFKQCYWISAKLKKISKHATMFFLLHCLRESTSFYFYYSHRWWVLIHGYLSNADFPRMILLALVTYGYQGFELTMDNYLQNLATVDVLKKNQFCLTHSHVRFQNHHGPSCRQHCHASIPRTSKAVGFASLYSIQVHGK